jgi:L-amino acid N-acyltransferase YncA
MEKNYPKSIKLIDGKQVILKLMSREDFEFSLGFFRRQPEDDRIYLRRDTTKREQMEERVIEIEDGLTTVVLAISDGMVVGEASLTTESRGWFRKTGELRVITDVNFRRKGLGNHLVKEIIEIARHRGLIKIMAECMEQQKGIQTTLKQLGFEQEGILKNFVLDLKEFEHDLVVLGKQLTD